MSSSSGVDVVQRVKLMLGMPVSDTWNAQDHFPFLPAMQFPTDLHGRWQAVVQVLGHLPLTWEALIQFLFPDFYMA